MPTDLTDAAPEASSDRYWLGDGDPVVEHLLAQSRVYAPEAELLLDALAVRAGASVIDVGCGALGIVDALCSRVGPHGRVVGLDVEPRLLGAAADEACRRRLQVEWVRADAARTGLPSGSFDLVHERTLLLNLTRPQDAVAEMTRLARPGGAVALQEPDARSWVCDPPHRAFDRLRAALIEAYRRSGKDFRIGRRLGDLLAAEGLHDVDVQTTVRITRPGDYYHTFMLTLCRLLRGELVTALAPAELDRAVAEVVEHLSAPGTVTAMPSLWQAWGVKH
jgi:SAM-dependent methyltransferase